MMERDMDILDETEEIKSAAEENITTNTEFDKKSGGIDNSVKVEDSDYLEDEEFNIDDFEVPGPEFFAQVKEPLFTINVNKVYVNAVCVRLLPDVEYVRIIVNRKLKQIAIEPSDELDIKAYKWYKVKNGKRYASQRTGEIFVMMFCKMMGWDPDYRYQIMGRLTHSNGKALIVFDPTTSKCFPKAGAGDSKETGKRKMAFPIDKWNGRFGPTYAESKKHLHVGTFEGYTVWTIKEGELLNKDSSQQENSEEQRSDAYLFPEGVGSI